MDPINRYTSVLDLLWPSLTDVQSERTALYEEHAEKLLKSGYAYRCFCSSEKLSELARRRASLGLPSDYDRTCEGLPSEQSDERAFAGEAFVVRLRVPSSPPEYVDLVYGSVGKPNHNMKAQNLGEALYEDPVLLKSDGHPTYHLANVVDDHHMKITHVVRAAVRKKHSFPLPVLTNHTSGMDVFHAETFDFVQCLRMGTAGVCSCWATSG